MTITLVFTAATLAGSLVYLRRKAGEVQDTRLPAVTNFLPPTTHESAVAQNIHPSKKTEPVSMPPPPDIITIYNESRRAAVADPRNVHLLIQESRSGILRSYGAIFERLNLPATTRDELTSILVDKQLSLADANALTAQSKEPRSPELRMGIHFEFEAKIKNVLGADIYGQLANFKREQPIRENLDILRVRTVVSGEIAEAEYDNIVAEVSRAAADGNIMALAMDPFSPLPNEIMDVIKSRLSPASYSALEKLQRERRKTVELESALQTPPRK